MRQKAGRHRSGAVAGPRRGSQSTLHQQAIKSGRDCACAAGSACRLDRGPCGTLTSASRGAAGPTAGRLCNRCPSSAHGAGDRDPARANREIAVTSRPADELHGRRTPHRRDTRMLGSAAPSTRARFSRYPRRRARVRAAFRAAAERRAAPLVRAALRAAAARSRLGGARRRARRGETEPSATPCSAVRALAPATRRANTRAYK
jgi:hypothetical protein